MSHKTALRGSLSCLKMQLTEQSKNGRSKGIAVWTMSPSNGSSGSTVTALFGHHIVCNEEEERVRSLDYELPAGAVTHAKKRIGKDISFWEQTSKGCLSHSPDTPLYSFPPYPRDWTLCGVGPTLLVSWLGYQPQLLCEVVLSWKCHIFPFVQKHLSKLNAVLLMKQ